MKHLRDSWNHSSAQIADAKAEQSAHNAELEKLQRAQLELSEDISELEVTITEAQKARASRLRAGLRETASLFADRSRFYAALESGDLFDATAIQNDKEAITTYERAKAEKIKELLKGAYQQAVKNQEERQRASSLEPIDAGVVFHQKGEQKLDIYFTALTNSTGGLVNNLTKAVHAAVQARGVSFADNNVEDLLRITVEGDYQALVPDLERLEPEGFKEAKVRYRAAVLGESIKPGREKRAKTALQSEEAIPVDKVPDNYMAVAEAAAILGIHPTHCYDFIDGNVSRKYKLPDKLKPIRAIEISYLKELCVRKGRTFPGEAGNTRTEPLSEQDGETDTAAEPVLENIVSAPTVSEVISQQSQVQRILGDEMFAKYVTSYDTSKVEEVVGMVSSALGNERARILFEADAKGSLFKEQGLPRYLGRLNVLLSSIDVKKSEVPSDYSFEAKPSNFLPNNLSAIERKLEEAPVSSQPGLSDEMALKMDINPALANRLSKEGYNPVYVHAMLREGFGLGKSKQYIGEAYFPREYWRGRVRRALSSLGIIHMDESHFSRHENVFKSMGLLYVKEAKQGHPLSFSPRWAERASGAVKDYLAEIFHRSR